MSVSAGSSVRELEQMLAVKRRSAGRASPCALAPPARRAPSGRDGTYSEKAAYPAIAFRRPAPPNKTLLTRPCRFTRFDFTHRTNAATNAAITASTETAMIASRAGRDNAIFLKKVFFKVF